MIKPKLIITFLSALTLFLYSADTLGQNLAAYTDYMDHFYVFDHAENKRIEDLRPQSFKVGGECILYVNSSGHLKMYSNGSTTSLEPGGVSEDNYFATDHLGIYNVYEKLKVIYKGNKIDLSPRCTSYQAEDSLVAFYDKNLESLRVFYQGEVQDIESGMIGNPVSNWDSGDNIVAYISTRTKDFKIWYQGEVYTINKNVPETRFKAGRNIIAYIDPLDQAFKAFFKGEVYDLNDFAPESFKTGDDFVAFVDHMGEFKYFSGGTVETISTITPEEYITEDNSLAFVQDGRFFAWYNNTADEVEGWVPSTYKIDWNTIAYLDNSNRIWIYQNGERKYLANELVNDFEIYRDLIYMNVKVNKNIIYYQGEFHEGLSEYK